MPCKKGTQKTKHACILEAHESTRQRLDSSLRKDHEDHIAGKGYNSMTHYKLVHKFVPVPQMKDLRLQPCRDGQAADAVSAYTQVKLEDAPRLLRIQKSECPDVWIRLPRHIMAHIIVKH